MKAAGLQVAVPAPRGFNTTPPQVKFPLVVPIPNEYEVIIPTWTIDEYPIPSPWQSSPYEDEDMRPWPVIEPPYQWPVIEPPYQWPVIEPPYQWPDPRYDGGQYQSWLWELFAQMFMEMVEWLARERKSVGEDAMSCPFDLRLPESRDPELANTAIRWFTQRMWNPHEHGAEGSEQQYIPSEPQLVSLTAAASRKGVARAATLSGATPGSRFPSAFARLVQDAPSSIDITGVAASFKTDFSSWIRNDYSFIWLSVRHHNGDIYTTCKLAIDGTAGTWAISYGGSTVSDSILEDTWYDFRLVIDRDDQATYTGRVYLNDELIAETTVLDGYVEGDVIALASVQGGLGYDNVAQQAVTIGGVLFRDKDAGWQNGAATFTETGQFSSGGWNPYIADYLHEDGDARGSIAFTDPYAIEGRVSSGAITSVNFDNIDPFIFTQIIDEEILVALAWLGYAQAVVYGHG